MPAAARLNDFASHLMTPIAPGTGSPNVKIGYSPAWRALPRGMGAGVESAAGATKDLVDAASLDPMSTPATLAKIYAGLMQDASKAAANGTPAAPGAVSSGFATLMTTNVGLTSAYTAAAAVPGGEPAARIAYTQAIKAATASFAAAAVGAIAGMTDTHICPQPSGPIPHGPGVVTRGSRSVTINGLPACRESDSIFEAAGGSDPIKKGCKTVLIGDECGSPGSPEQDAAELADAVANAERLAQAQSAAAALVAAAAAGRPLIEVCPQCERLRETARSQKHRVGFRVVLDESNEPVAGVALRVTLPDGRQEIRVTDSDGLIEIDDLDHAGTCTVTSDAKGGQLGTTFDFVRVGEGTESDAGRAET